MCSDSSDWRTSAGPSCPTRCTTGRLEKTEHEQVSPNGPSAFQEKRMMNKTYDLSTTEQENIISNILAELAADPMATCC